MNDPTADEGEQDVRDVRGLTEEIIRAMAREDPGPLRDEMRLAADLGLDSLRLIELAAVVEQRFHLPPLDMDRAITVSTVKDVVDLVADLTEART